MSRTIRHLCLVLTISMTTSAMARSISAVNDGHIRFSGANGLSTVTDRESIQTSRSGGSNVQHGLFEFDLSLLEFSTDAIVESATVQFELVSLISNTSNSAEVAFYGFASDSIIEDSDFDNPSPASSNLLKLQEFPAGAADSPPVGDLLTIEFDNLQPIQDAISAGEQYLTIRSETVNFVSFRVGSLEHATAIAPKLDVEIVTVSGDFDKNGVVDIRDIDEMIFGDATYDLDNDGDTTASDLDILVTDLIDTWYGDSNGDGEFSTDDFIFVFSAGKFETGLAASWSEGDWNHDGVFDTTDFIKAFADGGFELGPRPVASTVPEPYGLTTTFIALVAIAVVRRRHL